MGIEYRNYHGRLAQFKQWHNTPTEWTDRWSKTNIQKMLAKQRNAPQLGEYNEIFTRYLPKDMLILEAGCGMGQIVMALACLGYLVEGIDYAEETIKKVKEAAPELNVHTGDIYHLDVADETYGGYISLGVLEHDPSGPQQGLQEARRVLHPRGFAFFSIPFLNLGRQKVYIKADPVKDTSIENDLSFYQYYYSDEEFESFLNSAKFQVVEKIPLSVYWGLIYDHPVIKFLSERNFFHWRIHRSFRRWCQHASPAMRNRWAHMIMYVCKPT